MKKSQRLRLASLVAAVATLGGQATALPAAQQTELTALQALAAQHPDASKDTDDTAAPPAAAPAAAPANSPAQGESAPPAAGSPVAASASPAVPAAAPFAGFLATLSASLRSKTALGSDLTTARASIASLTRERDEARASLAPLTAERDTARAHAAAFCGYFGIKPKTLAGQTPDQLRATIDAAVNTSAAALLATLGVPAANLPAPKAADGSGDTLEDIHAALATERDPVKAGQLAAKANQLRDAAWAKSAGKN